MSKYFFWIGVLCVFLFLLPYFILGDSSYIIDGDNLDSNVVWYKVLAESGKLFAPNLEMINGIIVELPRVSFPSEMNVIVWLYYFFEPWAAYLTNIVLMRLVAFCSMFLLLNKLSKKMDFFFLALITSFSLLFSYVSFYPSAGLSVPAQPLVIYAILKIREDPKAIYPYFILFLFPFYSNFVLSGLFVGIGVFCWIIYDFIIIRKLNYYFLTGFALMVIGSIIAEYRLFLFLIDSEDFGFISHRTEMQSSYNEGLIKEFLEFLFQGEYYSGLIPPLFGVLLLVGVSVLILKRKFFSRHTSLLIFLTFSVIILASIIKWEGLDFIYKRIEFLRKFQFDRIFFLLPVLFFLSIFSVLQDLMLRKFKWGAIVSSLVIIVSLLMIVRNDKNYSVLIRKNIIGREVDEPTFKSFYATKMFSDIKNLIGKDAKVINFGIHPAVAQFNKITTLDGYIANYPLVKKDEFLNMLGENFRKNENSYAYISTWGSRLYIFDDEYLEDKIRYKWSPRLDEVVSLEIDWSAVKKKGGDYLISTNPVNEKELEFLKKFNNDESAWQLYLYKIPKGR